MELAGDLHSYLQYHRLVSHNALGVSGISFTIHKFYHLTKNTYIHMSYLHPPVLDSTTRVTGAFTYDMAVAGPTHSHDTAHSFGLWPGCFVLIGQLTADVVDKVTYSFIDRQRTLGKYTAGPLPPSPSHRLHHSIDVVYAAHRKDVICIRFRPIHG